MKRKGGGKKGEETTEKVAAAAAGGGCEPGDGAEMAIIDEEEQKKMAHLKKEAERMLGACTSLKDIGNLADQLLKQQKKGEGSPFEVVTKSNLQLIQIFVRNTLFSKVKFIGDHQLEAFEDPKSVGYAVLEGANVQEKGRRKSFWTTYKPEVKKCLRIKRNDVNQAIKACFLGKLPADST